jgi:MFS family permease
MRNREIVAIDVAGLIQGVTLVAFPAASTILTHPQEFNFSSTAYGSLFIPQAIISIVASWLSMKLNRCYNSKSVYLVGLFANLFSMVLLALSAAVMHHYDWAYSILLIATGCLGLGFGLTVPTLNTMAALIRPKQVDSTILILNALLGIGATLAPVLIGLFIWMGFWWGLPSFLAILILLLFAVSIPLTLPGGKIKILSSESKTFLIPSRFWIFATFALLYGMIETLNSNWIAIYMRTHETATFTVQSLALAAFWGTVTIGRIFFALFEKYFHSSLTYQILPFVVAVAFVMIAALPSGHEKWEVFAFGVAGLGCSALLPLTISFGSIQLRSIATSVAGGIMAFYLLGYGIAAFGVGPLQDMTNLSLREIYASGVLITLILGILAFCIVKDRPTTREEKI